MSVARKRRLKIKKKNFTIFIICILMIIGSITYGIKKSTDQSNIKKEENNEKINKENNGFENASKLNYYIKENETRYQNYRKEHQSLSTEEIIIQVNIGLDNEYYTNSSKAPNLNTF